MRVFLYSLGALVLCCTLLYFAATRTEVGREALGRQIEAQFASSYFGELEIGAVKGNLRRQVFLSNVHFYDEDGQLWLSIDSVVATPRWNALLGRRFEVGSVKVVRPTLSLRYDRGRPRLLRRRATPGNSAWEFDSADLVVEQGSATRILRDTPVGTSWLDRLLMVNLSGINARATIEWGPSTKYLDIASLEAALVGKNLTLHDVQVQLGVDRDSVLFHHFNLRLGSSHIRSSGAIAHAGDFAWQASLDAAMLDFAELQTLLPWLPPDVRMRIAAQVRATAESVYVTGASLTWNDSRVIGAGTASGMPDSIVFAIDLAPSTVTPADVAVLLPEGAVPTWLLGTGPTVLAAATSGTFASGALRTRTSANGRALGGSYSLTAALDVSPDFGWTYEVDVSGDALALPPAGTMLSGRAELQGEGVSFDSLDAKLTCTLGPSLVAGRALDSLHLDAVKVQQQAAAAVYASRGRESIALTASTDWSRLTPRYDLSLRTTNLDLGPMLGQDSLASAITGALDVVGQGFHWDALQGALSARIDAADIQIGSDNWKLPEHVVTAEANAIDSPEPRLVIAGDLVSVALRGNTDYQLLKTVATLWATAARDALERQFDNLYANAGQSPEVPQVAWPPLDQIMQQDRVRATLRAAALDRVELELSLQVKQAGWLGTWLRVLPSVPRPIEAALWRQDDKVAPKHAAALLLEADAETIALEGSWTDSTGTISDIKLAASLQGPLEEVLDGTIAVQAPQIERQGFTILDPRATIRIRHGVANLDLSAGPAERFGPASLDATVNLLDDRYRATLNAGSVDIAGQRWQLEAGRAIDLFWDAIDLTNLSAVQAGQRPQHVSVAGHIASSAESNVTAHLQGLSLQQISEVLNMRRHFAGHLDGTLHWSATAGLVGHAMVDTLSLDGRVLGNLEANSHFIPGAPDVDVEVKLRSLGGEATFSPLATPNDITVTGTMRLKGNNDPGSLNLALEVARLDAFLLEELITITDNAEGFLVGSGTVTGTFEYPVFEADIRIPELRFDVPVYNLAFEAAGSVRVNERGIHISDLAVTDSTGGSASLGGTILFNRYRFLSLDVAGSLDELQIMNVPAFTRDLSWYGRVWASGDATLTGPIENAFLRSNNLTSSPQSEVYIPIRESHSAIDPGFIVYRDPSVDEFHPAQIQRRTNILDRRPETERRFGVGLEMDLNITGPEGSTIKLVIDPLLGDVITGIGTARVQLQLNEGEMRTYGTFDVASGDYLFTAGEVFVRRFLINEGSIQWAGDPLDPTLDIQADYRTRASRSGLPEDVGGSLQSSLPLIVDLDITGKLNAVQVGLSIALDQRQQAISNTPLLEAYLNQSDRAAQHATSVLLTNSFLLSAEGTRNDVIAGSALNSVSQLASSQLNRYLSHVLPNADFALGVVSDETAADLDVSAGIALRLLDERLLIRGHGIYRGQQVDQPGSQGLEGEFVVEIQLSPTVSVDLFYRREGDVLSETLITSETGVGLNYRAQFSTWRGLWESVFKSESLPADSAEAISQ